MARRNGSNILVSIFKLMGRLILFIISLAFAILKAIVGLFFKRPSISSAKKTAIANMDKTQQKGDSSERNQSIVDENKPLVSRSIIPIVFPIAICALVAIIVFSFNMTSKESGYKQKSETPIEKTEELKKDVDIKFANVEVVANCIQEDKTNIVKPHIKIVTEVTNMRDDSISSYNLPALNHNGWRMKFKIDGSSSTNLEPQKSYEAVLEETFPVDTKPYSFIFEESQTTRSSGLDNSAEKLTSMFAEVIKTLPERQRQLDDRIKAEQNRPFEFADVKWAVENKEVKYAASSAIRTVLSIDATVTNASTKTHDAEELPMLSYGTKAEPFAKNMSISPQESAGVHIALTFDESAEPYTFQFTSSEGNPSFNGLDGIAEELTKAFSEKLSSLPQEQAAFEQEQQAKAEEAERKKQEQAAETERTRQEKEAEAVQKAQERTVWVLGDNKTYHINPYCRHIRNKGAAAMTLVDAVDRGCKACGTCS